MKNIVARTKLKEDVEMYFNTINQKIDALLNDTQKLIENSYRSFFVHKEWRRLGYRASDLLVELENQKSSFLWMIRTNLSENSNFSNIIAEYKAYINNYFEKRTTLLPEIITKCEFVRANSPFVKRINYAPSVVDYAIEDAIAYNNTNKINITDIANPRDIKYILSKMLVDEKIHLQKTEKTLQSELDEAYKEIINLKLKLEQIEHPGQQENKLLLKQVREDIQERVIQKYAQAEQAQVDSQPCLEQMPVTQRIERAQQEENKNSQVEER